MAPQRRSHCPKGHPYTEANSYHHPTKGGRVCRECHRQQSREWEKRKRAEERAQRPRIKRRQKRDKEGRWVKGPDRTPFPAPGSVFPHLGPISGRQSPHSPISGGPSPA